MTATKLTGQSTSPNIIVASRAAPRVAEAGHSFDALYVTRPRVWLAVIVLAYVLVAVLYAANTPPWQAPDEPAHYNYIRHIAETGTLPVLELGDYSQEELELLLEHAFAPKLSISALRYESYQPPLYYLSAVPIYWLTGGSLLALRLYGVLLGACTIVVLYLCLERVFPTKPLIGATAAAFAAMLPMHVAMTASVNNDGLSDLLLVATFLALLQWMYGQYYPAATPSTRRQRLQLLLIGLLLGLGMLTKFYAYLLLPIVALVVLLVTWLRPQVREAEEEQGGRGQLGPAALAAAWVIVPPLLMVLPLWLRNMRLYGAFDPLGLSRHDAVVVGQPTTSDWIALNGWVAYGERAFSFTFKSFWGVFGWMGVFMDERIYTALLIFTGIIFLGLLWATVRLISGPPDTDMDLYQTTVQALFAFMLVAVLAAYLGYNARFVQHQGRYFFWGLLPISAMVAIGWREVLQPVQGAITGLLVLILALSLVAAGILGGTLAEWPVLILACYALVLIGQPLLLMSASTGKSGWRPARLQSFLRRPRVDPITRTLRIVAWAIPFVLLFVLNLAVPFVYLGPQLAP